MQRRRRVDGHGHEGRWARHGDQPHPHQVQVQARHRVDVVPDAARRDEADQPDRSPPTADRGFDQQHRRVLRVRGQAGGHGILDGQEDTDVHFCQQRAPCTDERGHVDGRQHPGRQKSRPCRGQRHHHERL